MELNGKTLSGGVVFRVPANKWKLSLESSGTVIGDTSKATGVRGVIEVAPGGSLNIHGGTIKIQNKGAEAKGAYAPSIMVVQSWYEGLQTFPAMRSLILEVCG